jgi:hypothetical protein
MNISSVSASNPVTSVTPVDAPKAQGTTTSSNGGGATATHQPTPPPPLPPGQGTRIDQLV